MPAVARHAKWQVYSNRRPSATMHLPPVAYTRHANKSRDVRCFILFASWRWRRSISRQVAFVIAALDQLMRQPTLQKIFC